MFRSYIAEGSLLLNLKNEEDNIRTICRFLHVFLRRKIINMYVIIELERRVFV